MAFSVIYMNKKLPLIKYFHWLLNELKAKKHNAGRVIIYCQTLKQCSSLYSLFIQELTHEFVFDKEDTSKRMVEMMHSLSPKAVKETVLKDMGSEDGNINVLICTIAFGMGVNCKAVNTVIHFGS